MQNGSLVSRWYRPLAYPVVCACQQTVGSVIKCFEATFDSVRQVKKPAFRARNAGFLDR